MKLARTLNDVEARKIQTLVLLGGVSTTLTIWTKLEDPINLPKMFVLALFGAIALGLVMPALLSARKLISRYQRFGLGLIGLFAIGLLISTSATDVRFTAIFGEYHRNNGAISLLACTVLAVASGLTFGKENSLKPLKWVSQLGLFLSIYGVLQYLGRDPVEWNNQYNPIITTLGNPNFTSGIVGIASIASLYFVIESKNMQERLVAISGLALGLFIVFKSESVQGIFAFVCGAAILALSKAWEIKRGYGVAAGAIITALGLPVALAVLNVGPLASRLYQGTLNNRLDYWQAAINMFQAHPILGVGIDRYGEYYREFAVQNQYVQGMFTNNAHNVYLHLLATGGLTLFIPYLLLIVYLTWLAVRSLVQSNKQFKSLEATYLGIWLGFLLLNLVTIDNIGVGVWLWIFGGIIIGKSGLAKESTDIHPVAKKNPRISKYSTELSVAPSVAIFVHILITLVVCVPLLNNSTKLVELKFNLKALDQSSYKSELLITAKSNSRDPQSLANLANFAIQKNDLTTALTISKMIENADSRSFYASFLPAIIYEGTNKRKLAIPYRENLLITDKWNTGNMLELVKSYIGINDTNKATEMAAKIESLYPGSEDSKKAQSLVETLITP